MSRDLANEIKNADALIKLIISLIHPSTVPTEEQASLLKYALSHLTLIKTADDLIRLLAPLTRSTTVLSEFTGARETIIEFGLKNLALIKTEKQLFSTLNCLDMFARSSEIPAKHGKTILHWINKKSARITADNFFMLILERLGDLIQHLKNKSLPAIPSQLQIHIQAKHAHITTNAFKKRLFTLLLDKPELFSTQTRETLLPFVRSNLDLIKTDLQRKNIHLWIPQNHATPSVAATSRHRAIGAPYKRVDTIPNLKQSSPLVPKPCP